MPNISYYAVNLECESLKTSQVICDKVKISNSSRALEVFNDDGKVVFFVDNLGASVNNINSSTQFTELSDTPYVLGNENSILGVKDGKIEFLDDLIFRKVESDEVTSKKINTGTMKTDGIVSKSIVNETLTSDKIKCTTLDTNVMTADTIVCDNMKLTKFDIDSLSGKELVFDTAIVSQLKSESVTSKMLASTHVVTENLETEKGNFGDITTNVLTSKQVIADNLKSKLVIIDELLFDSIMGDRVETKEIICDKLNIVKSEYGSETEPLNLAITQVKFVEVSGENIKIVTKCPSGVLNQAIQINGLDHGKDYAVNITLNTDNNISHTFIDDGSTHKLKIVYKTAVERDTIVKIYIRVI